MVLNIIIISQEMFTTTNMFTCNTYVNSVILYINCKHVLKDITTVISVCCDHINVLYNCSYP